MSTAAKVLSPFFYFCCFRCVIVPLTGVINYVFCIYICCFIANFGHRTRLGSKQLHSHRVYIVIFSFLFMQPLKPNHELIPILTFRVTQCHDLDHSGSRDVIVHVTILFPVVISYRCSIGSKSVIRISNRRRDNGPQIYWGHDLDLSGSRDHSNPNGPFLIGVLLDPSLYFQPFSRYLALSILGSRP